MDAVKKANEGTDSAAIQKALDQLTAAQHKAAESLYKQGAAAGAGGPGAAGGAAGAGAAPGDGAGGSNDPKGDVIDAEVVDEGKQ
jgi:molecular chaperone DnaK